MNALPYNQAVSLSSPATDKPYNQLVEQMRIKHQELLAGLQGKKKIRVVFLVLHENTWKADEVFQRMLDDDFFEPVILVVPFVTYDGSTEISRSRTLEVQNKTIAYFLNKNHTVYAVANENASHSVTQIEELKPDLVYFSCPYPEASDTFFGEVFKNYLSFYIPYFYMIYSWDGDDSFYNTDFYNSMLRTYLPHKISYDKALEVSSADNHQWFLSGYPSCEKLYAKQSKQNAWQQNSIDKIKLIWAPHHSIFEHVKPNLGSFLFVADYLKEIAVKYQDRLCISFKPHPLLKSKLDDHPDWGEEKTNAYYQFWQESGFSQLDEGEYVDLFLDSDAMLHDSSSFLVEYLFTEKPVMYIDFKNSFHEQFNAMGLKAYAACQTAKNMDDIERFIMSLLAGQAELKEEHYSFLESDIYPFYQDKLPSERIIDDIKDFLGASREQ